MPDEKIEVNYVRWRLGNSYKCKELLASFLTALSLIYAFYLIAVSPPPAQLKSFPRDCCTHKSRHNFREGQMTERGWKRTLLAFSVRFSFEIEKVAVPTIKMS